MTELTIQCSTEQVEALDSERATYNQHLATLKPPGDQATFAEYAQLVWDRTLSEKVAQHKQRVSESLLREIAQADTVTQDEIRTILTQKRLAKRDTESDSRQVIL